MNKVEEYIHKWLNEDFQKDYAEKLVSDYQRFMAKEFADNSFETEFTSGSEAKRSQRIWEVELACFLMDQGYELESEDFGPDLKTTIDDQTVWFEAVSPEPEGIPNDFLKPIYKENNVVVGAYPANEILLRVQWGIYQKYKKLQKYLKKEIVSPKDSYIIAIDLSQLMAFSVGISGLPVAIEALFPVGPRQLTIDRETGKTISSGISFRSKVVNKDAKIDVPTEIFSKKKAIELSAVLTAKREMTSLRNPVLIHNPFSESPFARQSLKLEHEYIAEFEDDLIHLIDLAEQK